jgi:integrase
LSSDPALRRDCVLASLSRFADSHGLGAAPTLSVEMIEAYCALGLTGAESSTIGTYRSVLRALAENVSRSPARPYAGAAAPPPYSEKERTALHATARSQSREWLAHSAEVLLTFSIGAGLRPGELCELRGQDVKASAQATLVEVAGRVVRMRKPYAERAIELAEAAGDRHLFHPGDARRSYKNFVNDLCAKLLRDPEVPAFSAWRCRSSFICDHMAESTPLTVIAALAGLASVCSLRRHARHVAGMPTTNAGLLRRAAEELARQ